MSAWTVFDWLRHRSRLKKWTHDAAWGRRGEDLAHRHLRRHGYTIVARNYRTRSGSGEVDLIAWDGPVLAFIEVKARATDEFGAPDRAVDIEKQERLIVAAADYARRAGVDWEKARFDIVSIVFARPPRITHQKDAFAKNMGMGGGAV